MSSEITERSPSGVLAATGTDVSGRRKPAAPAQFLEGDHHPIERIERLGKSLFGVAACVVVLQEQEPADYEERQEARSAIHLFCAQLPVSEKLRLTPDGTSSNPFQPALGQIDKLTIHFQAVQPLRDGEQKIVGSLCLLHDRPRAFTRADREQIADLAALVERELQLKLLLEFQRDLQRKNKTLRRKSLTDPLIGCWNRGAIMRILTIESVRCKKLKLPLAVILVDLDHFKKINDTHGHQAGDTVLIKAAGVLRAAMRQHEALGRYGGEEFLIVLPGADHITAQAVAERMRETLALQAIEAGAVSIRVSLSAGVAATDVFSASSTEELVRLADSALYAAKESGRNLVMLAEPPPARA